MCVGAYIIFKYLRTILGMNPDKIRNLCKNKVPIISPLYLHRAQPCTNTLYLQWGHVFNSALMNLAHEGHCESKTAIFISFDEESFKTFNHKLVLNSDNIIKFAEFICS